MVADLYSCSVIEPVPETVEQVLDVGWLSDAMAQEHPGCRVSSVEVVSHTWTIASKLRIELAYDEPGSPPAPGALCVKGYFRDGARLGGAGGPEALYYRDLAARAGVRTAVCHYVGLDEKTGRSVLLLQDLARPGTTLRNALTPFTPDESAAALEQLAHLHAGPWDNGTLALDWLSPRFASMVERVPPEALQKLLDRPRADGLPDDVRNGRRVHDAMRVLGEEIPSTPTLLHGDTHAGNIFFGDRTAGLYDWQLVQRGSWALDVSYHIGAVMETEVRRQAERELLRGYLDQRSALGATMPEWDEAFEAYRRHLAYGYFLWSMTQFTDEAITTATIRRLGHAVADHSTFELLGV